jgi:hypothetical protein
VFLFTRSSRLTSFFVSRAYILLDDICMISITDDNAIIHDFSHFFDLRSFLLFHCHSATHFKAFCNNNHIWYTSLGLSPSQAPGFGKPSIRAWLTILKAQAHQSQTQARALSPSQARYITRYRSTSKRGRTSITSCLKG